MGLRIDIFLLQKRTVKSRAGARWQSSAHTCAGSAHASSVLVLGKNVFSGTSLA